MVSSILSLNESVSLWSGVAAAEANSTPHMYTAAALQHPSRLGSALGAVIAFLFILFGICGDALIIAAILSKRELRNNLLNVFIVSCQLNDIFNIGFNQFLVGLSYTFMSWQGPYLICEFFVYTSIISTGSLLWHHSLISIHRYLIVVCNLNIRHLNMSPRAYVLAALVLARLIPTLVCLPAFIARNSAVQMTVYSQAALRCMLAPGVSGFQNLLIVLINMLVPCVIIIFCFVSIFTRVHSVSRNIRKTIFTNTGTKSLNSNLANEIISNYQQKGNGNNNKNNKNNKNINSNKITSETAGSTPSSINSSDSVKPSTNPGTRGNSTTHNNMGTSSVLISNINNTGSNLSSTMVSMHREIQISKMFASIFLVFLFGYLPYGIIRMLDRKNSLHPDVYVLLTVIFIISISISPIIYGLMNNQIRMQCLVLLKRLSRCRDEDKKSLYLTTTRRSIIQNEVTTAAMTNRAARRVSGLSSPILLKKPVNQQQQHEEHQQLHMPLLRRAAGEQASTKKSWNPANTRLEKSENMSGINNNSYGRQNRGGCISVGSLKNNHHVSSVSCETLCRNRVLVMDKTDDGGIYKGPQEN